VNKIRLDAPTHSIDKVVVEHARQLEVAREVEERGGVHDNPPEGIT